ncbi:unnamed protein product [Musa textilis]
MGRCFIHKMITFGHDNVLAFFAAPFLFSLHDLVILLLPSHRCCLSSIIGVGSSF